MPVKLPRTRVPGQELSPQRIVAARITEMPQRLTDPMPVVYVTMDTGFEMKLFDFFPDEISFRPDEFVGLTIADALMLKQKKDMEYLRA